MVRSLVALLAIASTASAFLLPAAPNKLAASSATVMHASRDRGLQDRRVQLERVALAGLGITMVPAMPAFADSTGKYSTKQTAKKRYLPRVRKGVKLFVDLGKTLDKPDTIQAYNQYIEDNLGTALSLFGASTRIGELPDKGSRTVEAEVEDFIKLCKALGKAKDAADAKATYEKAKTALVAYLKATKLEPLGDPIYNQ